jgi:hypothetical protein
MRAIRLLTLSVALGLLGGGAVACAKPIDGKGTLAEGVVTPGPTGAPADSPTESPAPSPTGSAPPSTSPSPTADQVKTKERVTCVLVQATIKTTNDKFNSAKSRKAQLQVLSSGAASIGGTLKRSGLNYRSHVFAAGWAVLLELRRIVQGAQRGGNPSTGPYNTLTTRFRTACLDI